MKLLIDANTRIIDLQKKFNAVYPFLKVEFHKRGYFGKRVSSGKDRIPSDKLFSAESEIFQPGSIDINRHRSVGEVEKDFFENFGIAMQISRKSGNIWIETSRTDDRTLKAQNLLGKMNSLPVGVERERMDVD